jgi:hypothetical protein
MYTRAAEEGSFYPRSRREGRIRNVSRQARQDAKEEKKGNSEF